MAIFYQTEFDQNFHNAADGSVGVKFTEFRAAGKASSALPLGATIVVLTAKTPDYKKGDKVTVTTSKGSFTGTISVSAANPTTTATPYVWLENGVDYIKGARITGGSMTHAVAAAAATTEVASTTSTSKTKYIIGGIIVIVAAFLLYKNRKKIFAKK
jgi:hypothetical protein